MAKRVAMRVEGKVQARAPRKDALDDKRLAAFLAALAETANVQAAADAAGLAISSIYNMRRSDPRFAAAWGEALCLGYAKLEMLMLQHAISTLDGAAAPAPDVIAKPISERGMLTLLGQHRQSVREINAAKATRVSDFAELRRADAEAREQLMRKLSEMAERMNPGADAD